MYQANSFEIAAARKLRASFTTERGASGVHEEGSCPAVQVLSRLHTFVMNGDALFAGTC